VTFKKTPMSDDGTSSFLNGDVIRTVGPVIGACNGAPAWPGMPGGFAATVAAGALVPTADGLCLLCLLPQPDGILKAASRNTLKNMTDLFMELTGDPDAACTVTLPESKARVNATATPNAIGQSRAGGAGQIPEFMNSGICSAPQV
jgi:hypothetical protein